MDDVEKRKRLADAFRQGALKRGDGDEPLFVDGHKEGAIYSLGCTFNSMADDIEQGTPKGLEYFEAHEVMCSILGDTFEQSLERMKNPPPRAPKP